MFFLGIWQFTTGLGVTCTANANGARRVTLNVRLGTKDGKTIRHMTRTECLRGTTTFFEVTSDTRLRDVRGLLTICLWGCTRIARKRNLRRVIMTSCTNFSFITSATTIHRRCVTVGRYSVDVNGGITRTTFAITRSTLANYEVVTTRLCRNFTRELLRRELVNLCFLNGGSYSVNVLTIKFNG